jgi:hypothetical protein
MNEDADAATTAGHLSVTPSVMASRGIRMSATALASIYLVTYWAGLRGGDRAMVRPEPTTTGAQPAPAGPTA